jgi:hypothetical protein
MTIIATPPADLPDLNDRLTYAQRAIAVVNWQATAFPQVNTVRTEIEELQVAALGAANYKGEWSGLSGALAIPASVNHNGNLYYLISSLADVTTKTPGVASEWGLVSTGYAGGEYTGDVAYLAAMSTPPFPLTGTAPALNPNNGVAQLWTLTANSTPTDALTSGEHIILGIDDGTARTVTWPTTTWLTAGAIAPELVATGRTWVLLFKMATTLYGARIGV